MERLFSISEVARDLCRSVDWLREAERKGRIPKAKHDLNGWRVYSLEDIERLHQLLIPRQENQGEPVGIQRTF